MGSWLSITLKPCPIALVAVLQDTSPEAIQILLEEIEFAWHEILGVPPNADAAALRRAMLGWHGSITLTKVASPT